MSRSRIAHLLVAGVIATALVSGCGSSRQTSTADASDIVGTWKPIASNQSYSCMSPGFAVGPETTGPPTTIPRCTWNLSWSGVHSFTIAGNDKVTVELTEHPVTESRTETVHCVGAIDDGHDTITFPAGACSSNGAKVDDDLGAATYDLHEGCLTVHGHTPHSTALRHFTQHDGSCGSAKDQFTGIGRAIPAAS